MYNQFSTRILFATGAVFAAVLLTASNLQAGWFEVPAEPADWGGPYVSFNGGGVFTNYGISDYGTVVNTTTQFNDVLTNHGQNPGVTTYTDPNDILFVAPGHSSDDSSGIAGVDLGWNWQRGMFVFGLGFGFSGSKTNDASNFSDLAFTFPTFGNNLQPPAPFQVEADTQYDTYRRVETVWTGYAGGQIGFAWNRFFFYADGGSAFAEVDTKTFDQAVTNFFTFSPGVPRTFIGTTTDRQVIAKNNMMAGWYAGGGAKYAVSNAVAIGAEFRHADYGDKRYHFNSSNAIFPGATFYDEDSNSVVFTVSILLGHLGEKPPAPPAPMGKK
jgi:opacity protein-like surface antigen